SHLFIEIPLWLQYGRRTNWHPTYGVAIFKNVKKFSKTGTVSIGTVFEFLPTKVQGKGTCHDHQRATGEGRRDREISSVRSAADATRHRVTINFEVGDQCEDASANGKGLGGDEWRTSELD
ncbi:MAG: hypothetical protein EZS28_056158, partial [Streblomastix strix]